MVVTVEVPSSDYASVPEDRLCDIVMKGGITSGVVYPLALCELARKYRFKSIGGTSAGAIAAVLAVAGEFARVTGRTQTFEPLQALPSWLGERSQDRGHELEETNLVSLFRPQAPAHRVYRTAIGAMKRPTTRWFWFLLELVRQFKWGALLGTLPGLVALGCSLPFIWKLSHGWMYGAAALGVGMLTLTFLLCLVVPRLPNWLYQLRRFGWLWPLEFALRLVVPALGVLTLLLALAGLVYPPLLLIPLGAFAGAAIRFVLVASKRLPGNGYGLCLGSSHDLPETVRLTGAKAGPFPDPLAKDQPPKPLTEWLADLIDVVAGKEPGDPLTFGDLWDGRAALPGENVVERRARLAQLPVEKRRIDLQMMTTNLTLGAPFRLPFEWRKLAANESRIYFRRDELLRYFPLRVVDSLEANSSPGPPDAKEPEIPYRELPDGPGLPVVVAARLSLSFPILLSALPLYVWDTEDSRYRKCWFSDGGISSNFPVHFFDAPLPAWPTFAINLRGPRRAPQYQDKLAWVLQNPDDPLFESVTTIDSLGQFLLSIKDTMQNWKDNAQLRVPGWRERVGNIGLRANEGGLNLYMPENTVRELGHRGGELGKLLAGRFADADSTAPLSWQWHRWRRYRSSMAVLSFFLRRLDRGWKADSDGETFVALAARAVGSPPPDSAWADPAQQSAAKNSMDPLLLLAASLSAADPFEAGAPLPEPDLRIAPDV